MKKLLCLLASVVGFAATAQLPYCTITPAGSVWNTAYDQTQYYWYPDQGQQFTATIYENTWHSGAWYYYPAGSIGFGSGPYYFYDNSSSGAHPMPSDKCFVVVKHSVPSFAQATSRGWLPQATGSVDSWGSLPGGMGWDSACFWVTGYAWEVWLCQYNKMVGLSSAQFIAGGNGAPPPNVDSYAAVYGQ